MRWKPRPHAGVSFGGRALEERGLPQFNFNKFRGVRNPTRAPATIFKNPGLAPGFFLLHLVLIEVGEF
jgi:hypothetical protein